MPKHYILKVESDDSIVKLETPTGGVPYVPVFETEEDARATKEWLEQDCGYPTLRIDEVECSL